VRGAWRARALQAAHAQLVVDHGPFEIVSSDSLYRPEI
jgi:hypothetical protein